MDLPIFRKKNHPPATCYRDNDWFSPLVKCWGISTGIQRIEKGDESTPNNLFPHIKQDVFRNLGLIHSQVGNGTNDCGIQKLNLKLPLKTKPI